MITKQKWKSWKVICFRWTSHNSTLLVPTKPWENNPSNNQQQLATYFNIYSNTLFSNQFILYCVCICVGVFVFLRKFCKLCIWWIVYVDLCILFVCCLCFCLVLCVFLLSVLEKKRSDDASEVSWERRLFFLVCACIDPCRGSIRCATGALGQLASKYLICTYCLKNRLFSTSIVPRRKTSSMR